MSGAHRVQRDFSLDFNFKSKSSADQYTGNCEGILDINDRQYCGKKERASLYSLERIWRQRQPSYTIPVDLDKLLYR